MRKGLKRYYGLGHLHFLTFSCYRRLALLRTARARNLFVHALGKMRECYGFALVGYVVMPEHVHLRCVRKMGSANFKTPTRRTDAWGTHTIQTTRFWATKPSHCKRLRDSSPRKGDRGARTALRLPAAGRLGMTAWG